MSSFAPNTDLTDARRFRAGALLFMALFLFLTFGLMAAGVDDHRLMTRWDVQGKQQLHEHAQSHAELREFFVRVTQLGNSRVLVSGAVLVIVVLAVLRCWTLAGVWALTTLGGFKLVQVLKAFYDRGRPEFLDPLVELEQSQSFPSGHAAGSAMLYGMFAYLVIRATRRVGWVVAPLLGVLIALIGFSRIYLGAHWFSDVVGGWVLGFGWVALGMALAEETRVY